MHNYLIKTHGTATYTVQGSKFYNQEGFFWFVDGAGNCLFAKDAKEISSIELIK
jgi:hypothetical protein